jgi:hypothetical protein
MSWPALGAGCAPGPDLEEGMRRLARRYILELWWRRGFAASWLTGIWTRQARPAELALNGSKFFRFRYCIQNGINNLFPGHVAVVLYKSIANQPGSTFETNFARSLGLVSMPARAALAASIF